MAKSTADAEVIRWLLDVEELWPTPNESSGRQSTAQWATGKDAQYALNLLSSGERDKVLRFYFPNDAKLCLGSCLLKRRAITELCGVPWSDAIVGEDSNRKPCYRPVGWGDKRLEFNVSHHGTLVALVACAGESTRLGVDIARMNWQKDSLMVMKDGFESWTNTYEAVFSDREIKDIARFVPSPRKGSSEEIQAKLRHFYAHWCLKEAYVKMTGEALLASWLKELEFRDVRVPQEASQVQGQPLSSSAWGQICRDVNIFLHGKRVEDVQLEIQAFRHDYMISTSASNISASLGPFTELDVEHDVYPF